MRALRPLEQLALLLLFGLILLLDPVGAAVIPVDGACTLVDAVNAANNDDDSSGLCPPGGSGADEIVLTGDVILTEIDNAPCCPFGCVCGLPMISSEIIVDGQGHSIARDPGAPAFNIFSVAGPGGILTTQDLTISNAEHAVGTITGLDPLLADNGGPTLTHALLTGSSAIDAAGDCGLETDQRLFLRHDGACYTGAYELGGIPSGIFADGFESGDLSAWSATVP